MELQLWATWLLYAVLVDLTDAVAEALEQPFDAISMEMVFRSLYYAGPAPVITTRLPMSWLTWLPMRSCSVSSNDREHTNPLLKIRLTTRARP